MSQYTIGSNNEASTRVFNDIERLQAEVFDNALCRRGTDSLHEAAAQILFQFGECGSFGFICTDDLVLTTKFGMLLPEARQAQGLARVNIGESAKDRDQLALPWYLQASHGVATFF